MSIRLNQRIWLTKREDGRVSAASAIWPDRFLSRVIDRAYSSDPVEEGYDEYEDE
jgi:hypothetical protein